MNYPENPLLYYAALAAAIGACLYLFISVKEDLAKASGSLKRRLEAVEKESARLGSTLDAASEKTARLEERIDLMTPQRRTVPLGIGASARTQVVRLSRRGDRPEQIAAQLDLPENEVDLLLKVHRAVAGAY